MEQNITMVRGDTLSFGMEFEDLDQDLTSAYFSVKKSYSDSSYTLQKSLGSGITKVETGKYRVRVAPSDTANVDAGNYFYDLQVSANSDVFTILRGMLTILPEVTV